MNSEHLNNLRHSCAHLLAKTVKELWPGTHNAIGPSIEDGFYQDFDFGRVKISENDLPKIEEKMREIVRSWKFFEHKEVDLDEARMLFQDNPYKLELLEEFAKKGKKITINDPGNFVDLCKGGHCEKPYQDMKHFKLLSVAGAYWRGDEKNQMLTRIYGTCFPTKEELDAYINMLEEAKKRDHRKLGKELGLFTFSEMVGSGLPLFTPKGTVLRDELTRYSEDLRVGIGYQRVWIPHITKKELYETSGHWAKFGAELFLVKSQETDDQMVMKPMNCPHHQQIYASEPRSYRDLPLKFMETTTIYRDEKAGELLGLSRVRSITQDDSHTFCTPEQIEEVYGALIKVVKEFYGTIGMKLRARLSYRDKAQPEKYLGEAALWDKAESIILDIAKKNELDYYEAFGEAAFYGPKIDFMALDAIGREWQVATPQLDFVQPARFGLTYTDKDGEDKTPVMVHFALMGSIERFLSVYIEHTAGNFPLWLSPVQVHFIPVSNDKHADGAKRFADELKAQNIRVQVDSTDETVGKKIRKATKQKIPYIVVVGENEISGKDWNIRFRGQADQEMISKKEFVARLQKEIQNRVK
ncbi:MAG: threonine--tRNA ligase [Candidatus Magasanikbacteria bacterium]|nr:threonine--tRNA ligase [Candidatus Magasanikbacteria bacterium]